MRSTRRARNGRRERQYLVSPAANGSLCTCEEELTRLFLSPQACGGRHPDESHCRRLRCVPLRCSLRLKLTVWPAAPREGVETCSGAMPAGRWISKAHINPFHLTPKSRHYKWLQSHVRSRLSSSSLPLTPTSTAHRSPFARPHRLRRPRPHLRAVRLQAATPLVPRMDQPRQARVRPRPRRRDPARPLLPAVLPRR